MSPVTQERFERLGRLFHQALGIPAGEDREAFLARSSGGDPALIDDVHRLLERDSLIRQAEAASTPRSLPRFGAYQARELIGQGGMGAVYLATREDGEVTLRVAVKAISSPLWSSVLEDRFRRERQILSQLRHPGIAAFLDGGVSDEGLPFLVMEYVEGEPIDRYCDSHCLSIRRRLELFLEVCSAVAFAHQQLVVHRDIKPGNILVARSGEVKLLDFGLARPLEAARHWENQREDQPTLYLTPRYSSPEMLRGRPAAATDDVFSLGVLLYELLSGKRPFGTGDESPSAIIQAVLEADPPPVSRIEGPGAGRAAEERGQTVAGLRRALRGDLDAIAAKAMERSAARRYSSVEQLALDVGRHLGGHPIEARPANSLYRARKFATRHKTGVAAAALTAISLIGGGTATVWESRIADRRFAQARELAHYLMFDLHQSIAKLPGSTPVRAEMVAHSLQYLDRLSSEKIRDPILRTEVGEGYAQLGTLLGNPSTSNIGQPEKARESYRKAIAILEPAAQSPGNRRAGMILANTKINLGRLLDFESNTGRPWIQAGTADFARLVERWPNDYDIRYNAGWAFFALMRSLSQSSGAYLTAQNMDASLAALKTSISNAEAAARLEPHQSEAVRLLAIDYMMGGSLQELRDPAGATWYFRQGVDTMNRITGKDREIPVVRSNHSSVLLGLGRNLGHLGQPEAGLAFLEEARQIRDRLAAEDPENIQALYLSTTPYYQLAEMCRIAGRPSEELRYRLADIAIYARLLARDPTNHPYRLGQAEQQAAAANVSWELGKTQEAERLASAGIPELKQSALRGQASAAELLVAASALLNAKVARFYDPALGLVLAQRAVALNGDDIETLEAAAQAYWLNRDPASAVRTLEHALELLSSTPTPDRKRMEASLARYRGSRLR